MDSNRQLTRRTAIKRAGSATVAAACPYWVPDSVLGQKKRPGVNDRIRTAVIGVGMRGKYLIANLPDDVQVVALCDTYLPHIDAAIHPQHRFAKPLAKFSKTDAPRCTIYQDYRRLLESEQLDAVIIATPDHHHVLAAILACQAGLDIYCEKPLSLTINEGRALVRAVQKSGCILQVGSQQRTMEVNRIGCEFVRQGGLGRLTHVDLPNYPGPMSHPAFAAEPVPNGLQWDLFCGPSELRPHHPRLWVKDDFYVGPLLWRGWDLWDDYSGHMATNWGAHSVDMVQWALGHDHSGPVKVRPDLDQLNTSLGKAWFNKTPPLSGEATIDNHDAMRFCPVTMVYADGVELRWATGGGNTVFHGEKGRMIMTRNRFRTDPIDLLRMPSDRSLIDVWTGTGHVARPHLENWVQAIRSRGSVNAPVEVGHRSVTVCHLANIARTLCRTLSWDPETEQFVGDEEANRLLQRPRRAGFELPTV